MSGRSDAEQTDAFFQARSLVVRALEVLSLISRDRGSTIAELHHDTGLPKPTLVRLLETLAAAGYVAKDEGRREYRVTHLVERLSVGF